MVGRIGRWRGGRQRLAFHLIPCACTTFITYRKTQSKRFFNGSKGIGQDGGVGGLRKGISGGKKRAKTGARKPWLRQGNFWAPGLAVSQDVLGG